MLTPPSLWRHISRSHSLLRGVSSATRLVPATVTPRFLDIRRSVALFSTANTPSQSEKPYYITTPIFYVNAVPHVGHLHSAVLADTFKRFHELKGQKAIMSVGTDEHGLKIQQAAAQAGMKEIELCDSVSKRFRELFDAADISYTTYIRTTEPRHAVAVKELWERLWAKGYIYKGQHEGWYSVSDEAFYPSGQVQEQINEKTGEKYHIAIETGKKVEWTTEENYKFKLSAFRDKLLEWLDQNPEAILPRRRYAEVQKWLQSGLEDLSVSRPKSRLTWGIPIPGDDSHVMYVWMDALTNYLTVTGYPWGKTEDGNGAVSQGGWPADAQVIGKDILRFHAVYWPAFLMAADMELPKTIIAHAHWTQSKMKMSKSSGNVVDPFTAMQEFGTDTIRFYLMNDGGLSDDADYASELVAERYRKLLGGQLGNLLSRSTSVNLNPSRLVPTQPSFKNIHPDDMALHLKMKTLPEMVDKAMAEYRTTSATSAIFSMLAEANIAFSQCAPWKLIKDPANNERLNDVLWYAMESTRIAGIMLQPIMPTKAAEILDILAIDPDERTWEFVHIGRGWANTGTEQRRLSELSCEPVFPHLRK
ncbi:methionyl-tRNA synthetase [Entomortierella parvispora]|uniref:Probable methionine--tRNA ligase, mitochondrial n=1 Tax=Entomortierella parvispora TaxID=205924 RepID=A0A9P3HL29_9FUNG|nr:methionyl-tRNA synthetase [Entomortierella parvispora]